MIQRWSHKVSDRRISSEALKIKIAGNGLRKYRKRSALGVFSESSRAGENFDGKTSDITSVTDASHAETATIFFLFRIQWTFVYNPKLHFFSCSFILHFDCFFVSLTAALVVVLFFGWCVTSIKHGQRQSAACELYGLLQAQSTLPRIRRARFRLSSRFFSLFAPQFWSKDFFRCRFQSRTTSSS